MSLVWIFRIYRYYSSERYHIFLFVDTGMKTSSVVKELARRKNLNILVGQMTWMWRNLMMMMPIRLSIFSPHLHLSPYILLHICVERQERTLLMICMQLSTVLFTILILSFSCSCDLQKKQSRSTHEKELEKLRSEIEDMEKANLEPKMWTMQGEVIFINF